MIKLYRGQVIEVSAPAGFDENGKRLFKPRPVIVLHTLKKNSDIVSVYCTTQNNGEDAHNIFVEAKSKQGVEMGITKDTYIRPGVIKHLPVESFKRLMGTCPYMHEITRIKEKIDTGG